MNKLITLSVISLTCMVAMATAFFGPVGTGASFGYPPVYPGAGGGTGLMGGGFFSIIMFLFILSFLGKGNLLGGGGRKY